jgi:hypothetical protein
VASVNNESVPEMMEVKFLHTNLLNQNVTAADTFNILVGNLMRVISDLIESNASKQSLDEYISIRIVGSDDVKKVVA